PPSPNSCSTRDRRPTADCAPSTTSCSNPSDPLPGPARAGPGPFCREELPMSDLRIDSVETVVLDIPLRRPHRFARFTMEAQPVLLVFLRTAGGISGMGEGSVPGGPWWGGESVETMQLVIDRYVKPFLLGRDVDDVAGISRDINDVLAANRYAKGAVEIALLDAWARSLGV